MISENYVKWVPSVRGTDQGPKRWMASVAEGGVHSARETPAGAGTLSVW